jgi:thiol-disulfide isomerase/thioredoxin
MKHLLQALFGLLAAVGVVVLPQIRSSPPTAPPTTSAPPVREPAMTFIPPTAVPTLAATPQYADYPNYGPAAELRDDVWLNTDPDQPLRLADLRGQVVLLEFWTFECINCIHVLLYVHAWYNTYHDQGLTVIGIHYPEFSYEADYNNLVAALKRLDVPYPVAQDNDGATWRAYGQRYWPTLYLIDKRGNIRYQRIGEGGYGTTEQVIQDLLAET